MKFLDVPELSTLTSFLSSCELGDRQLKAKLEAYSCKPSGDDKKLGKKLEQLYLQEIEQTPMIAHGSSPLGVFCDPQTRRLLINLICTMNAAFPDYDFSTLKPEQFLKEDLSIVVKSVNSAFVEIVETISKSFLKELWGSIDSIVDLKNCQVFSYIPDLESDPFSLPANLWSFNYFFVNRTEKKLVFFACSCRQRKFSQNGDGANDLEFDTEVDGSDDNIDSSDPFGNWEEDYTPGSEEDNTMSDMEDTFF